MQKQNADTVRAEGFNAKNSSSPDLLIAPADGAAMWQRLAKLEKKTSPFDAQYAPTKGRWSKRASGSEDSVQLLRVLVKWVDEQPSLALPWLPVSA
jgi:hypothetical protein